MESHNLRSALVVGCADCVWEDVRRAEVLCKFDAIYCVKMMGVYFPRSFRVWATLHPEHMLGMREQREVLGLPGGYEVVAPPAEELTRDHRSWPADRRVSFRYTHKFTSPGSGLYGAMVAVHDGFSRVVLAGCPMTATPYFYEHKRWKKGPWDQFKDFDAGLRLCRQNFAGRVRSMSGRTREMFGGEPTREWLAGCGQEG